MRVFIVFFILSLIILSTGCNKTKRELISSLPTNNIRTWVGPEFWANPLQDWQLENGKIECVVSGGFRNIFLLTKEIGKQSGDFSISVRAKNLNPKSDTLGKNFL